MHAEPNGAGRLKGAQLQTAEQLGALPNLVHQHFILGLLRTQSVLDWADHRQSLLILLELRRRLLVLDRLELLSSLHEADRAGRSAAN